MTDRVPTGDIERIVGVPRRATDHILRLVSDEQRVYILHSAECFEEYPDLRHCPYSISLDDYGLWDRREDPDDEGYFWDEDVPIAVTLDEFDSLAPIDQPMHVLRDARVARDDVRGDL